MSIYTRRGDAGTTSLATGERVSKSSARVEAYGAVDEANSAVGLALASAKDPEVRELLRFVQQRLFNCSSALAGAQVLGRDEPAVNDDDVSVLEKAIDRFEDATGRLDHFVIEGGCETAARLHVARATVRRAERRIVALGEAEPLPAGVERFVNRLSDALFACARYVNLLEGSPEVPWDPRHPAPGEHRAR